MTTNPFCTARFAPGVLPWIAAEGELASFVDRACAPGARLQILGPHGSGKSTLLVHLARGAERRGFDVRAFRGSHGLGALSLASSARPILVLADEAEELGAVRFACLRAFCRARRASLVITAHRDFGLETLCERAIDVPTVEVLVGRLLEGSEASRPTRGDIDALVHRHRGNVREVFFDLYDRVGAR